MKIIISPAKKMNIQTDWVAAVSTPIFAREQQEIYERLRTMTYSQLKGLWRCSDKIAELNYRRLQDPNPPAQTPALIAYEGIQYQYMAPGVFSAEQWAYVQAHLRVLSGLYGLLTPLDGVMPYRLEMQALLEVGGKTNLYEFWGDKVYRQLYLDHDLVVNLASKEYSKVVEKYLIPADRYLTCIFGELADGKVKVKATQAKMARGEMVNWMAENQITRSEQLPLFKRLGYQFSNRYSTESSYVFLK